MGHDVFISHSSQDKVFADAVCAALERNGLRCWVAPRDILPGANWAKSILKAIGDSRMMVLVFSGHVHSSQHIRREVERAVHHGIPIAPIRIEDVMPKDDLEYYLSSSHWMDAITPPADRHLKTLARQIRALLTAETVDGTDAAAEAAAADDARSGRPAHAGQRGQPASRPPPRQRGKRRVAGLIAALLAVVVFGLAAGLALRGDLSRFFADRGDRPPIVSPPPTSGTLGTVERLDPALDALLPPGATLEVLLKGQGRADGPVWSTRENCLYFADLSQDAVYRWTESAGASVYLKPAGYAGVTPRGGEPAANALALDPDGRLTLAGHGDRRVSRLERGYTAHAKISWIDRVSADGKGAERLISQATDVLTSRDIPILVAKDKELQAVYPSLADGRDLDDPAVQQDVILKLRDVAIANLSKGSQTVDLQVTGRNPVEAAQLANAFARAFVQWCQIQMRGDIGSQIQMYEEAVKNATILKSALTQERTKLAVDNRIDFDALKQNNALTMAMKLMDDQFVARVFLAAAEAKLKAVQNSGERRPTQELESLKLAEEEKAKDSILQTYNRQLAAAVGMLQAEMTDKSEDHPNVKRQRDQVDRMKALVIERETVIASIIRQRIDSRFKLLDAKNVAEAQEAVDKAQAMVAIYTKQIDELDKRTKELVYIRGQIAALDEQIALVARDFEVNYANLQAAKQTEANITFNSGIKIAEYATPPTPMGEEADAAARRPGGTFRATLADRYEGKRLNGPHSLTYDSKGDLLFTDPPYGLEKRPENPKRDLPFQGVYRLSKAGKLTLLTEALKFPGGLALSPDERTLYVADADPDRPAIRAFDVAADGTIDHPRVLFDAAPLLARNPPGLPGGLKVDPAGNLWASGPGGILILSPAGKHLGTIATGQRTANCVWGGEDGSTLYVTADAYLCRIKTTVRRR